MKFDGMINRAKDRGVKLLLVQLNPSPRFYSTVPDKEISRSLGAAMAIVAKTFADKSNGKYKPGMVLEKLLLDVSVQARLQITEMTDESKDDLALKYLAKKFAKEMMESGEFDEMADDEQVESKPKSSK
jgi:hypothetical protein